MEFKLLLTAIVTAASLSIVGCQSTQEKSQPSSGSTADVIYQGGSIISMNDAEPAAEALAVKDGKILAVGLKSDVLKTKGDATKMVDLGGKALLPGFIDGHSHFINSLTMANQANVYAPPFGPGNTIEGIVGALKELKKDQNIKAGETIMAYGYDENALPADHQLSAADLDPHFPDNPVMVGHVSLHGAVLNSVALKKYNITAETKTPEGGIILRKPGSNEPAGLLMEMAFLPIFSSLPKPGAEESMAALEKGQMIYAAAGITTAQEGASHTVDLHILQQGAAAGETFHRRRRVSIHHRPRLGPRKESARHLRQIRPPAQTRRRQDHGGRFPAGPHRILYDALSSGQTLW